MPESALGKQVQCPACQKVFVASTAPIPVAPPPSTGAPPRYTREEDDEVDRSRRKRRRRRDEDDDDDRRGSPHRGGEILAYGLLALIPCVITSIIFGVIAIVMANGDLDLMRRGRMDRDGEGTTQAGRAMGILGIVLWSIAYLIACLGIAAGS